jgi:hypothetical protein
MKNQSKTSSASRTSSNWNEMNLDILDINSTFVPDYVKVEQRSPPKNLSMERRQLVE